MSTYKLQIKYNDVLWFGEHTGYALVEYDNNDNPIDIYVVDLMPSKVSDNITFEIQKGTMQDLTSNFFEFQDTGVVGTNAIEIFNKIALEASIINLCSKYMDYNAAFQNCNTSTAYFAEKYLPEGTNCLPFWFISKYFDFTGEFFELFPDGIIENTNNIFNKIINDALSKGYDFGSNILEELIGSAPNLDNFSITLGDIGYHVLGTDNSTVSSSNDADIFYTLDMQKADSVNDVNMGGGNDTYYGGIAHDLVNGGSGDNTVYLGGGSDEYVGGSGVDVVDGGSNSNHQDYGQDLSGDTNTVHLGGGADRYTGGAGVDNVSTGSGNDAVYTYAGNDIVNTSLSNVEDTNKVYLGGGSDNFIGGSGCDIVFGGSGNNEIRLGGDKTSDAYFSNVTNGEVDVVWNSSKDDYIILSGGIREQETKGNDLYIYGGFLSSYLFMHNTTIGCVYISA